MIADEQEGQQWGMGKMGILNKQINQRGSMALHGPVTIVCWELYLMFNPNLCTSQQQSQRKKALSPYYKKLTKRMIEKKKNLEIFFFQVNRYL